MATVDRIAALRAAEAQVENLTEALDKELAPLIERYINYRNGYVPSYIAKMPTKGWGLGHSQSGHYSTVEGDHLNISAYYRGDYSDLELPIAYISDPDEWETGDRRRRQEKAEAEAVQKKAEKEARDRAEWERLSAIFTPNNPEQAEAY